jgi:glucose-6-phosphate 1-dehydrogenase
MTTDSRPSIITIFGITGDLSKRKLLPALYHLFKHKLLDEKTVILGITRRDITTGDMVKVFQEAVERLDEPTDADALRRVEAALRMHTMDQTDPAAYRELLGIMNSIEEEKGVCMNRLYYLSIPPQMFEPIVRNLGEQGLNKSCQHGTAESRLLVEKPFGYDLKSARELIDETAKQFSEEQIFRIDHYLAKDTVQDIIAFRQMTPKLEEIWRDDYISQMTITAYEKIDIEGRATFYEEVGALRDFIQSHLLQLLAVATMELPASMDSNAVHQTRTAVLQAIAPIKELNVPAEAVRGQYEGYRDEVGVADSHTETFARIHVVIDTPRWDYTMFTLQTGKAMAEKRTDVEIKFSSKEHGEGSLVFSVQPETGIRLDATGGQSAEWEAELQSAIREFNAARQREDADRPDAYERVLLDAVQGNHMLFTTGEEVLASWQVVNDVVKVWARSGDGLKFYAKGAADVQ